MAAPGPGAGPSSPAPLSQQSRPAASGGALPRGGVPGSPPLTPFQKFIFSGSRWHVLAGVVVLGVACYIPFQRATAGQRQLSHEEYMALAEKEREKERARGSRLSS